MSQFRSYRSESAARLLVLFALLPMASCAPDATTAPGEIAFAKGFITAQDLDQTIESRYAKNDYGEYLRRLIDEAQ